jgi:integrase/recombinase XerD
VKYFDEKPTIAKRQPHKRTAEKAVKKESVKIIFEKFLEAKQKQNLRTSTLNEHIGLCKNVAKFHESRYDRSFYLSDITTQFIADYVYWMKNEAIRYDGHKYIPEHAQTVGLSDATIEGRLKYLKTFVNWCLKEEILKENPFTKFEGFKKDEVEIEILTREELNKLLKVVKGHSNKSFKNFRDYVLLHLLVDSMLRITECLLTSPHDIDHTSRY